MHSLSDEQLLDVLAGEGAGRKLLQDGIGTLFASVSNLKDLAHLTAGDAIAFYDASPLVSKVAAAIEFTKRCISSKLRQGDNLSSPSEVYSYLKIAIGWQEAEHFHVMYLDAQNKLISGETLFVGTVSQTAVYPREVVKRALLLNASAVILAHNHPSGLCEPSSADNRLTRSLKEALALLDVRVLDHVIVSQTGHFSFAEHGQL